MDYLKTFFDCLFGSYSALIPAKMLDSTAMRSLQKKKVPTLVTLWCQLEDMFHLIGTSQGIERVLSQIIVTSEYFEKYRVKYKA